LSTFAAGNNKTLNLPAKGFLIKQTLTIQAEKIYNGAISVIYVL